MHVRVTRLTGSAHSTLFAECGQQYRLCVAVKFLYKFKYLKMRIVASNPHRKCQICVLPCGPCRKRSNDILKMEK